MKRTYLFLLIALAALLFSSCAKEEKSSVLTIAVPYSDHVIDLEKNYYVEWLEKETGLELEFSVVRQTDCMGYLNTLFGSSADIDIVMFGEDFVPEEEALKKYAASGDIYTKDGEYVFKNYGTDPGEGVGQVMWINGVWLERLGLSLPKTTDDLKAVLRAFKEKDPNDNGLADEIPFVGSLDDPSYSPSEFILGSFVPNDPADRSSLKSRSDDLRLGIAYLKGLYYEGLLGENLDLSLGELREYVNSPLDIVGAFTTRSISDVVYKNNPEIMARYVHVLPLMGPLGEQNAVSVRNEPRAGAIITGRSAHKEEAAKLLKTMLSEEASLIARFGEQGVDWDFSDGSDVSVYSEPATIVTYSYIWNTFQNKHLNGIGPMNVPEKYLRGVIWNGVNSDAEYIDGRAYAGYSAYLPETGERKDNDATYNDPYFDEAIAAFITGEKDIESDEEWEKFTDHLH